ncbi:BPSL0761 family protein [Paraburkholderia bannensis]|uniref:BPSL0761 family protein n=1 Tax=Paraburkholderia bannensis TaxID=765414 RepID=UPI002ABE1E8E|nr:BPSL0761 family protein [Paraburkholderia bannensis]
MTTPDERTIAVIQTRWLLEALVCATDSIAHSMVRVEALRLLQHYPADADLTISAAALPKVWRSVKP